MHVLDVSVLAVPFCPLMPEYLSLPAAPLKPSQATVNTPHFAHRHRAWSSTSKTPHEHRKLCEVADFAYTTDLTFTNT